MNTYLNTKGARVTKYRNQAKQTVASGFIDAFYAGYFSVGKNDKVDSESVKWLASKQNAEIGHVHSAFDSLREFKNDGDTGVAQEYADRYTDTLDGIFMEGKLRGDTKIMLIFSGTPGEKSCKTCIKWDGKRHSAEFWVKRGLIPGQPGNPNFECGGYRCQHGFIDDDGNQYEFL